MTTVNVSKSREKIAWNSFLSPQCIVSHSLAHQTNLFSNYSEYIMLSCILYLFPLSIQRKVQLCGTFSAIVPHVANANIAVIVKGLMIIMKTVSARHYYVSLFVMKLVISSLLAIFIAFLHNNDHDDPQHWCDYEFHILSNACIL